MVAANTMTPRICAQVPKPSPTIASAGASGGAASEGGSGKAGGSSNK